MVEKRQFTLKWLFVEMTLVAACLPILRWFFFTTHNDDTNFEAQMMVCVGAPFGIACIGAAIGGLFGRFAWGAAWGILLLLAFVLVSALFPPVQ